MSKPYEILSKYYEDILDNGEYQDFLNSLLNCVKRYSKSNSGIDCACGSGLFTRKLKENGFNVVGVDLSEEMLKQAKNKSIQQNLNIQYICQDMKNLKTFNKVGFISVVNDGINYISGKDLLKTFKAFNKCLIKGGFLIFDISSEYKLKTILSNNVFCDDDEKLSYVWFNSYNEENNLVNMQLSFFEKQGDVYLRFNEEQSQFIHSYQSVVDALNLSGFSILEITDDKGEKITSDSQKIVFMAVKN